MGNLFFSFLWFSTRRRKQRATNHVIRFIISPLSPFYISSRSSRYNTRKHSVLFPRPRSLSSARKVYKDKIGPSWRKSWWERWLFFHDFHGWICCFPFIPFLFFVSSLSPSLSILFIFSSYRMEPLDPWRYINFPLIRIEDMGDVMFQ